MEAKIIKRRKQGTDIPRIHFVPAKNPDAHAEDPAKLGLILLNDPIETDSPPSDMARPQGKSSLTKGRSQTMELFKEADLSMNWSSAPKLGSGLYNLGNTCFMNSVLQCLLHTPPLAKLLASNLSLVANAGHEGFDPIRQTRELLKDSITSRRGYVEPRLHAKTLKRVSRSFRFGRQEDAHEYLIALLDAMHDRSIAGINPKPPPDVEMTSFIYRIFGGKIRSQVKCTQCAYESNTYDPFLDLSLEITHANSVEKALHRFTAGEALDGSNKYRCPKQNKPVRAIKRMTVEVAPNVLVVQLKRFEFSFSGRKISKGVEFHETLDLAPFMSNRPNVPVLYDLYGVLVHAGHSMHSGHYYCYIKNALGGDWHKFDDTRVSPTSVRNVLGQQAYILYYMRRQPKAIIDRPMPKAASAVAAEKPAQQQPSSKKLAAIEKQDRLADAKKRSASEQADGVPMANGVSKKRREPELPSSSEEEKEIEDEESSSDDDEEGIRVRKSSVGSKNGMFSKHMDGVKLPSSLLRSRSTRPGSVVMSKRAKRFEEAKQLTVQMQLSKFHGSPSPARKRRKVAMKSVPEQDDDMEDSHDVVPKLRSSTRKAEAGTKAAPTPDWPPLPSSSADDETEDAAPNKPPPIPSTKSVRVRGKAAADKIARGTHGAVEGWDGELGGSGVLRHGGDKAPRRSVDDYDTEYDMGKTKKVRNKSTLGTVESKDFDEAYRAKGRQQGSTPRSQGRGGRGGGRQGGGRGGRGGRRPMLGSIKGNRQAGKRW